MWWQTLRTVLTCPRPWQVGQGSQSMCARLSRVRLRVISTRPSCVRSGAVQPVLVGWKLPPQEVHAVHPSPRQVPAKVIGFVEWLQGEMGETWWSDTW